MWTAPRGVVPACSHDFVAAPRHLPLKDHDPPFLCERRGPQTANPRHGTGRSQMQSTGCSREPEPELGSSGFTMSEIVACGVGVHRWIRPHLLQQAKPSARRWTGHFRRARDVVGAPQAWPRRAGPQDA